MGKIIGKSALALAGLGVAGWLMNLLADLIYFSETYGNYYYGITKITLLSYLPWLILALGYATTLFLLFMREKHRTVIMVLNSMAVIVLYCVSNFIPIDVQLQALNIAQAAGAPVMLLSVMLGWLFPVREKSKCGIWDGRQGATVALGKSLLCLGVVIGSAIAVSVLINAGLINYLNTWTLPFIDFKPLVLSISVVVSCFLYRLMAGHKRRFIIMMVNIMILAVVWSLVLMPSFLPDLLGISYMYQLCLVIVCGNTAVVTFTLAFVFRGVEKHREHKEMIHTESGHAGCEIPKE